MVYNNVDMDIVYEQQPSAKNYIFYNTYIVFI